MHGNTRKMDRRQALRWIAAGCAWPFAAQLAGCGTIIYQERHGQKTGRFDATVIVMDGIGLLFFLIPGLVAFGVDFATGAIYLPAGQKKGALEKALSEVMVVPPSDLTEERVREVILQHTGISVDFSDPDLQRIPLESLDQLEDQYRLAVADLPRALRSPL